MALPVGQFVGKLLGRGASAAGRAATPAAAEAVAGTAAKGGGLFSKIMGRSAEPLTHYTNEAAQRAIAAPGGVLRGGGGIFAMPSAMGDKMSPLGRAAATGVSPKSMTHAVPVPTEALGHFEKVLPIGPYSAWKRMGNVRMAPPGEINMATGAFTPKGSIWKTRAQMYGPDALMWGGAASAPSLVNSIVGPMPTENTTMPTRRG